MINLRIPVKIETINKQAHHFVKYKHNKVLNKHVRYYLNTISEKELLPCNVTLIRVGPRRMDWSNVVASLKWVQDEIADFLIPGLQRGRADDDPRIHWVYDQRKGEPNEYALEIIFEKLDEKAKDKQNE